MTWSDGRTRAWSVSIRRFHEPIDGRCELCDLPHPCVVTQLAQTVIELIDRQSE